MSRLLRQAPPYRPLDRVGLLHTSAEVLEAGLCELHEEKSTEKRRRLRILLSKLLLPELKDDPSLAQAPPPVSFRLAAHVLPYAAGDVAVGRGMHLVREWALACP